MRSWGELKSLRAQSVGEVSAYWSCVQFSGYVEMKVSQPTTSRKAGHAPEQKKRFERSYVSVDRNTSCINQCSELVTSASCISDALTSPKTQNNAWHGQDEDVFLWNILFE